MRIMKVNKEMRKVRDRSRNPTATSLKGTHESLVILITKERRR
jgi:hypothetical protein